MRRRLQWIRNLRGTTVAAAAFALLGAVALSGARSSSCVPVEPVGPALDQWDEVSACGGFAATRAAGGAALLVGDYCDAEVLAWAYDATTETLALHNDRVLLNCCGDHAFDVTLEGDVYVARETDEPVDGTGRCHCMCVFDFHVDVSGIPQGTIALRLDRFVTESGEATVWEGTLPLADGNGVVVIDETDVGPWCGQ